MALEFPANPQEGERYTDPTTGVEYVYTGGKWTVDYTSPGTVTSVNAVAPLISDNDAKDPTLSLNQAGIDLSLCNNTTSGFINTIDESTIDLSLCDNSTSGFINTIDESTIDLSLCDNSTSGFLSSIDASTIDLSLCDNTTSQFITLSDVSYPVTSVDGQTGAVDLSGSYLSLTGGDLSGDLGVQGDFLLPNLPEGPQTVPVGGLYHIAGDVKIRLV